MKFHDFMKFFMNSSLMKFHEIWWKISWTN
jgi:hypothetical protein